MNDILQLSDDDDDDGDLLSSSDTDVAIMLGEKVGYFLPPLQRVPPDSFRKRKINRSSNPGEWN